MDALATSGLGVGLTMWMLLALCGVGIWDLTRNHNNDQ